MCAVVISIHVAICFVRCADTFPDDEKEVLLFSVLFSFKPLHVSKNYRQLTQCVPY